ncbi:DUF5672 family protein [Microseira wollei]|uniref:Probable UDP-N-acetylglucosamine--peptide N-acetylglucosaminyltransferase SPINDLY n=1 Tax=Microseira wollei NIES-4236 TaxID=2530354 RepID=A0AAV3XE83_9CYAN|nr:DUF5672 family protein [Microseira wollei]GET40205.1 TPR repeat-containing protein [Microseira wollei NIES-4236]
MAAQDSGEIQAQMRLGIKHYQSGRLVEAEACYEQVVQFQPHHGGAWHLLGVIAYQRHQYQNAIARITRSLELQPNNAEAYKNLGSSYKQLGDFAQALECYQKAIQLQPDYGAAYNSLGILYKKLRQWNEAIECYQKAIQLQPDYAPACNNLGNAYREQGELEKAVYFFRRALEIKPDYVETHDNLGIALQEQGKLTEAIASYRRALQFNPNYANARCNLGLALLLAGELSQGFPEYESRFERDEPVRKLLSTPAWQGEPLEGEDILLWSEQGLGDSIQFVRYALLLQQQGAKVTLATNSPLVRLFQECLISAIPTVINQEQADVSDYKHHISLMSLPQLFKTTPETIPAQIPYIQPPATIPPGLKLPNTPAFKIGIVWATSITNIQLYHIKSIACNLFFQTFEYLLNPGKIELWSLQVGADAAQIQPWLHINGVRDISNLLKDFVDTAAVIHQLDLVITVDTAVAHLAGAMGKPVWVLLPFVPDWRWQLQRQDTPWYPTMELFRQTRWGDWASVLHQVKEKLGSALEIAVKRQLQEDGEADYKLGVAYQKEGKLGEAIASYQKAIQLPPHRVEAYNNLGNIYHKQGKLDSAIACYQKAIELRPNLAQLHYNLGIVREEKGELDWAIACYQRAIQLQPKYAEAYNNLGSIYREQKQFDLAIHSYNKAIEIQPNNVAYLNRGLTLLLLGELEQGFLDYEVRFETPQSARFKPKSPMWDGSNIEGKSIVLWNDQGLGDGIQFVRYAKLLQARGAKVILSAYSALVPLFRECLKADFEVVDQKSCDIYAYDYHASLMSLPAIFKTTSDTIPNSIPYIFPPNPLRHKCILPKTDYYRIGIVWASGAENAELYYKKSCAPDLFIELLSLGNVSLYSLQVGIDAAKIQPWVDNKRVHNLSHLLTDFADTATVIHQLDLIVSVDTAVAHLAGAMGKPVWVLLPFIPDWRWQLERQDSPWYPTMRLFRQASRGDWTSAFEQIKEKLQEVLTEVKMGATEMERIQTQLELGLQYHQSGKLEKAEACYEQIIQQQPENADAWHLLGVIASQRGQFEKAIAQINRAIELNPDSSSFYNNIGNAYREQGNLQRAISYYQKAIQLQSDYADAHKNLADVYQQQGQSALGMRECGIVAQISGKLPEAISYYQRAIQLKPDSVGIHIKLGNAYSEQGEIEQAIECYQKAIKLQPNNAGAYNNLGLAYREQGEFHQAVKYYQKALQVQPYYAEAHANLGMALLLLSDFERGFVEYEWRFEARAKKLSTSKPQMPAPEWDGSSLEGKSILLWSEQGLGDAIQFVRYALLLQKTGAKVILNAHHYPLVPLFRECLQDKFEVVDKDSCDAYTYDYHASLMSLPHILKTTADNIPSSIPYIFPPTPLRSNCILPPSDSYRIGIVWASGSLNNGLYQRKSCTPELFIDLLDGGNVSLYSLQVGVDAPQIQPWLDNERIHDLSPILNDFVDTVTVIHQLDLVITVDTAVAHLAGAMGKPVWILLPFIPDWRWQLERQDSPWYPTMRLFRQPIQGDWASVFQQVKQKLQDVLNSDIATMHWAGETPTPQELDLSCGMGILPVTPMSAFKKDKAEGRKNEKGKKKKLQLESATELYNRGLAVKKQGKLDDAIACYQKAIQLQPNYAPPYNSLGIVYREKGQLDRAIESYQKAIECQENYVQAYNNLGNALRDEGKLDDAIASYQQALKLDPDYINAHFNLGNALQQQGKFAQAIECFQQVIQRQPNYVDAYSSLGHAYKAQENLEAAINCYQKAIQLQPDSATAHSNLGIALQAQGNLPEASQSYQRALQIDPNYWLALINLGDIWRNQGYPTLAINYYRQALAINPDNEAGKINLASALKDRGAINEAIEMSRQIVAENPSLVHAHQNLLLYLHYSQDCQPSAIYEEHKCWAQRHASLLGENRDYSNSDRPPGKRLRIGYVSGDFLTHSVSFFFEPLLTAHNKRNFEVICYANNNKSDATRERLRKIAADWREIYNLNDEQFAELVIQDKIDILVDLSGHTNGNRLLAFARKIAPIQVSYIGYPNTTGLDTIDYRITDNWADPEGQTERLHSEQLIRLPHGFLCYQPPQNYPEVSSSPVLEKGHITFGCFNNLSKVNPQLISYWANILKNVPESRMLIKSWTLADSGMRDSLHRLFQQQGIEPNRLELSGWIAAKNEHLSLYNQVDIALDTFPYNGTTTTCEAMWMGVPVITLAGQTHVSRVGVSLLSSVGWEELIAQSPEAYIQKAVNLANNRDKLPQMRANLRPRMQAAPLTNASLITQSLETAYRQMWRRWCGGIPVAEVVGTGKMPIPQELISADSVGTLTGKMLIPQDKSNSCGVGVPPAQIFDGETAIAQIDPVQIEAKLDSGIEYQKSGQLPEAQACYQQVLQWQPLRADAWHLLGLIAYQQEQYETAIEQINRAIALNSSAPIFHNNLGSVYQKKQKLNEAISSHQKAIQLQPDYAEAHYNLGVAYQGENNLAAAIECYQKVLQLQPNYAQAYYNLGKVYEEQKEPQQAVNCYQKAIQFQADHVEAYFCLANILMNQGYCTLAIDYFRQVLALESNHASAYNNLASTFKDQGKIAEAIAYFRQAIAADPAFVIAQSNLLFNLHYSDEYTPAAIYAEHQHWCVRNATPLAAEILPHSNNPNPNRRLRIGYVSADFLTHSVAFFFEPLLAACDRHNFHVICYANNKQIDATTQRLRQLADDWRQIDRLDDAQLADLIRQDAIDILVDLSGHTKGNRLLTFARQPAPVQVSYIGYPNTTGITGINYRIVDGWTDPEGQTEHLHTEQLIRLTHGFLCYKPPVDCPEVGLSPGLSSDRITFGSFNKLAKISSKLINYWAEILKSVPNSRLLLKSRSFIDSGTCDYLHKLFQQQGIAAERVELIGWISSKSEHLALYNQIDIALDTFPYNGTTTTCEAMWMGVPVITLAGETHVSRVGVSLLSSVGLHEYIAQSPQEYIQKAVDLANNKEKLPQLRANLRGRMLAAPLMDASAIARSLEDAYRTIWRHWCSNNNASNNSHTIQKQPLTQELVDKLIASARDYQTQHFEWHCNYIYEKYLKHWKPRPLPQQSKYMAVIVENRCHPLLDFAIKNTLLFTPDEVGLQIFCTSANVEFVQNIVRDIDNVRIAVMADMPKLDPATYSRLLKTPGFWENIPAEKILIFQTDTLMTEPLDLSFFQYPYLGAPWKKESLKQEFYLFGFQSERQFPVQRESHKIEQKLNAKEQQKCRSGFGNGGLSIRDRQVMLDICQRYPDNTNYPEDLYFSYHVYKDAETIPDLEIARKFATETWFCPDSIGLHAAWKYLSSEQQAYFFEKHHKNILAYFVMSDVMSGSKGSARCF